MSKHHQFGQLESWQHSDECKVINHCPSPPSFIRLTLIQCIGNKQSKTIHFTTDFSSDSLIINLPLGLGPGFDDGMGGGEGLVPDTRSTIENIGKRVAARRVMMRSNIRGICKCPFIQLINVKSKKSELN